MRFLGKRLMHIRISENTVLKLAALLLLLGSGCQSPKKNPQTLTSRTPSYLVAGDVVKISFPAAPELNQTQKIGADGTLSLPLIGEVAVAGKTVGQVQADLARLYKPQLQDNEVLVSLDTRAVPVVVSGAVQKPGKIVFERPATVLEAIMEAGGVTPYGDSKRISVIRQVNGVQHTQIVDLSPLLHGVPTRVMYVNRGDVIYVRPRFISF